MATSTNRTVSLLQKLCTVISKAPADSKESAKLLQYTLRLLASNITPSVEEDELHLVDSMKKYLARSDRLGDAAKFGELYHQLTSKDVIRNKWAILLFLFEVGQDKTNVKSSSSLEGCLVADSVVCSSSGSGLLKQPKPPADMLRNVIGSRKDWDGNVGTPPKAEGTRADHLNEYRRLIAEAAGLHGPGTVPAVSETALLRDVLFVFQGIDGRYVKFDPTSETYRFDHEANISRETKDLVCKLSELGWLYKKVQFCITNRVSNSTAGVVERAFCGALHTELQEYFRLISSLEAQLTADARDTTTTSITLRRLVVWTQEPLLRMRVLAMLVDGSKGRVGGALASTIFRFAKHGDGYIQDLVTRILASANRPIYSMLTRWIYHGELDDSFREFFVSETETPPDLLWEHKYSIRASMLPTFISQELSEKILLIGKSINFIRHSCQDRDPLTNSQSSMREWNQSEGNTLEEKMVSLRESIDVAYRVVSKRLLEILKNKYQLMSHLNAARRYLLLGQGDFVRHLMDLLKDELAKPASSLFIGNLTSILDQAVQATNAQYDKSDVRNRLDAKLFQISPTDLGWDVFSLTYRVDGPLSVVFKEEFLVMYLKVFNFLWRAKRMEHILSEMWSKQMAFARTLAQIPGLSPLIQKYHAVHAAMGHFVNEIQYYFMFEVLECSWSDLLADIDAAHDLNQVIAAHHKFLLSLMQRTFLDKNSSGTLGSQLRSIFDKVVQFQKVQATLYQAASDELDRRNRDDSAAYEKSLMGQWAMTDGDVASQDSRRHKFNVETVPQLTTSVELIASQFQEMVGRFLTFLTLDNDPNLRNLSIRIDFNEHYKGLIPEYQDACSPFRVKKPKSRTTQPRTRSTLSQPSF